MTEESGMFINNYMVLENSIIVSAQSFTYNIKISRIFYYVLFIIYETFLIENYILKVCSLQFTFKTMGRLARFRLDLDGFEFCYGSVFQH